MHFNGEVTLGSLLQIAGMVAVAVAFYARLTSRMESHTEAINRHGAKLEQHDARIMDLLQKVAHIMGVREGQSDVDEWPHKERREYPR